MARKVLLGMTAMQLAILVAVVAAVSAVVYGSWPYVKAYVLGEGFYPIVSREVAAYREADKKQNLGVMEPDFSGLHREFAGVSEDSKDIYESPM